MASYAGIRQTFEPRIVSDVPTEGVAGEVLPLHAERLEVRRQVRQTGEVRVAVHTSSRDRQVDEQLARREVLLEHVAIDRFVDEMPQIREEGETTIIPVVEEILVRRLFLKEEVRITRIATTHAHREMVTLRYQDVVVSRTGPAEAAIDQTIDNDEST